MSIPYPRRVLENDILKRKAPPTYLLDTDFGNKLRSFGDDFIRLAESYFASETSQIECYVENRKREKSDDFSWASFPRDFYFAELAQIAVLNGAMWEDFCRAEHTVIFIPDCLSLMQDKCKRGGESNLQTCTQCVPNCVVNKIVALKERYEFAEVFAYRDQTKQFEVLLEKYKSVSFLGIACILMLADGMRTSMEKSVPAHGVPLKYCGCEHWAEQPFPTDTDIAEVERVLRLKAEFRSRPN
ncbi:MAG: DUF116 domain-containing protein [Candidatus Zixiibacteriota bacterium]